MWAEALNAARVSPSSELRNPKTIIFPPAFRTKDASWFAPKTSSSTPAPQPPTKGGKKNDEGEKEVDREIGVRNIDLDKIPL